jgi:hypothetical protein
VRGRTGAILSPSSPVQKYSSTRREIIVTAKRKDAQQTISQ